MRRLAYYRKLRGLTQRELAQASGINRDYISGFETGRRNPTREHCERLARILGIEDPRDILKRVPKWQLGVQG